MSASTDVARLLALVPWLLARPGVTVEEAAETFDVSQDQLKVDLSHLDFCGLPGLKGGDLFEVDLVGEHIHVKMADELRRPLRLGPSEAVRMVLILETAVSVLDDELPALRSGLAKVRLSAGVPSTVTVDVTDERPELASALRDAVRRGRRVRFGYLGRGDDAPRDRTVEPWAVRVEGGRLYLQGHDVDAQAARTFRLDRVTELAVLDDAATLPTPAQLPAPRWAPHEDDLEVVLELAPGGRWVAEALTPESIKERAGGATVVTVRTDAPRWVETLVLQAAGAATIASPAANREALAHRVDAALARYSG